MAVSLGGTFNPAADQDLTGTITLNGVLVVTTTGTQTLTNKTLTAPVLTAAVVTPAVVLYSADGAIATTSHTAIITKAGVGAMTLAATATDGVTIVITSTTSNAHVITGTNLFWAGETGGPFNKITLAAFPGSSATVVSQGSLWLVVSDQIATVGD